MFKKYIIIALIFFSFAGCSSSEENTAYTTTTIEEMYDLIEETGIILDVRTNEEYESYNLEGSINIPLDEIENVVNIVSEKDTQIFVYCASGIRSNEAVEYLVSIGYTNIYDMGGLYS